jgi:hypothetical protein
MLAVSAVLGANALAAQTSASTTHADAPVAQAVPLRGRIAVDGALDEAAWQAAPAITTFRQIDPDEGKPASEPTEVRVLYDADAIYIGAWLHDSQPVTSRLLRRDAFVLDSDWLSISFDSYHDHLTAFRFSVNPAGVRRDEVFSSGGHSGVAGGNTGGAIVERGGVVDQSWEPVWSAATAVTDSGWVAELRIPFSQLRFSQAEAQTWGLQVERRIARRQEQSFFAFTPKDQAAGVGTYGHLVGIRGIRPSQRLEVLPYASGRMFYRPLVAGNSAVDFPNPYLSRTELSGGMGADVKYRVTSNFTLDATLNPDFGQVELDPAVVNLTAFETKYEEKRPFFVEGAEIMRFGTSTKGAPEGGPPQMMYSRRVGRAPQLSVPSGAAYSEIPDVTTILGAAKLTGRAAGGWSVGIVDGVTQREEARFIDAEQRQQSTVVEPLTNYFAGRLKRDVNGGRTSIGGLVTAVNRQVRDGSPASSQLRDGAYVGGVDFRAETEDRVWSAFGSFSSSYVTGTPEAIAATQRASSRYFQRPDSRHLRYDPTATALAGYRAQVDAGKRAGTWLWNVALSASSPGYEINDLGYQTLTNRVVLDPNLTYDETHPGSLFRRWSVRVGPDFVWNYDGNLTRQQSYLTIESQLLNYWQVNVQLNHSEPVLNDGLTRGGPLTRMPSADAARVELVGDPRARYTWESMLNVSGDRGGAKLRSLGLALGFKPAENWTVEVGPELSRTITPAQYVATVADPTATSTYGSRYVFASLDQTTLGIDTRLNVTFTPSLSLELYAQPFLSSNDFGALKELRAPRTFDFDEYGRDVGSATPEAGGKVLVDPDGAGPAPSFRVSDRDFNLASLRGNAVLRWEWRPGSTFYLVWQQERSDQLDALDATLDDREPGRFHFGRNVRDLFDARPINVLLFKVSYWLNP